MWKFDAEHPWEDEEHTDVRMEALSNRIEEVLNIRTQHDQLTRLLTESEHQSVGIGSAFDAFDGLQPLQYNPCVCTASKCCVGSMARRCCPRWGLLIADR